MGGPRWVCVAQMRMLSSGMPVAAAIRLAAERVMCNRMFNESSDTRQIRC